MDLLVKELCRYTHEMCSCSTHGGRVCQLGRNKCILSDIPAWTDDMTACVKSRFPSASISVHGAGDSLTGFHVVISLEKPPLWNWEGMTLFAAVLSTSGLFGWYLFS